MAERNILGRRNCDGGETVCTRLDCGSCVGGICQRAFGAYVQVEPEPEPAPLRRRFRLPTTLPAAMALLGAVFIAAHWLRDLILSLT